MLHRDPSKLFPHDYVMRYTFVPLVPRFITPNMITVFRMVLVPFILYFLFYDNFQIGVPLFLFAAFTDALDGSVARLRHQVTEWGTFYDPFADKLLVGSVVILVVMQHINPIFGGLILFFGYTNNNCWGFFLKKKKNKNVFPNSRHLTFVDCPLGRV